MKTKYIILIVLCCYTIVGFAQKKSTYLLSPVTIKYQILQPTNSPKTESQKTVVSEKQTISDQSLKTIPEKYTEVSIPDDAFDGIDKEDIIESQKMTNDCYIAYLIKTNLFKQSVDRHLLNELCNDVHIQKLSQKYDKKILKRCGKHHNKELNIYIK